MPRSWRALWLWGTAPRPERLAGLSRPGLIVVQQQDPGALELSPDVVVIQAQPDLGSGLVTLHSWRERGSQEAPVVLLLDGASAEDMSRAVHAGFLMCVDDGAISTEALAAILICASELGEKGRNSADEHKGLKSALAQLAEARFRLRTPEEARHLARLLAAACPEPERRVAGFVELLVNAIEHGNLGIGFDTKSQLLARGAWLDEVERRLQLPENRQKMVDVQLVRREGGIEVTITDSGPGFHHSSFLSTPAEGPPELHGRGITVARRLSFDDLTYLGPGNQVRVLVRVPAGKSAGGAA
jgi:hypothetical protein